MPSRLTRQASRGSRLAWDTAATAARCTTTSRRTLPDARFDRGRVRDVEDVGRPRRRNAIGGFDTPARVARAQGRGEPRPHKPAPSCEQSKHHRPLYVGPPRRDRSASTISVIIASNVVVAAQPKTRWALEASPKSRSTSAGRKSAGSIRR